MLVRRMVQHHFDNHPDTALVGGIKKRLEMFQRPEAGVDGTVICDVVAIIAQRRWEKRHEPDRGHAEILQIVELLGKASEVADAVASAVEEGPDVDLVDDSVLVPEGV